MNVTQFVAEVYVLASEFNPDINHTTSYKEVVKELQGIKDKALRMDIIISSLKLEPQLPNLRPTLRETQARRQGQL